MQDVKVIKMLSSQGKILYALSDGPKSLSELLSITGLSVGTIYYNIKELIIHGFVIKVSKGKYSITKKGLEVLHRITKELQTVTQSSTR